MESGCIGDILLIYGGQSLETQFLHAIEQIFKLLMLLSSVVANGTSGFKACSIVTPSMSFQISKAKALDLKRKQPIVSRAGTSACGL